MSGIPIVRLTGNFGTNVLINGTTDSGLDFPHSLRPDNSGTPARVWNADGSLLFFDQSRAVTGDPANSARSILIDMTGTRTGAPGRIVRAASSPALGQGHSVWWFWDPLNPARAYVIADNGAVSEWWPVGEQGHAVGEVNQLYGPIAGYDQFRQGRAHLVHCSWDGQYYVQNCRRTSDGQRGGIRRNLLTGALGPFIPWPDPSNDNGDTDRTAQGTSALGRYTKFSFGGRQYVVDVTNNQLMFDTNNLGLPGTWSHSDWTVINGREYLVAPVGGNGIYMIDILTGQPTRISNFATGNPNHMSNRNYKDLAQTYGQVGNVTSGQRYGFLIKSSGTTERGIRAFRMDPAGPENVLRYIVNHRCERTGDSYSDTNESEAHCQASPDGRMVSFPSNWRVPGVVTDYDIHGYVALIPAAWWNPNNDGSGGGGTPPAAPSGLAASAVSSSQINLSWTDNSSNETGFRIERKTGLGGTYAQIDTVGAGVTSYNNNSGLTAATTYYYRVRATNGSGDSAYSNEANATTQSGGGGTWTTITYDDFEGGFGNYTTSGGEDCTLYTGGTYAHQGSNAMNCQDNSGVGSSFWHASNRNVSTYSQLRATFWYMARGTNSGHDFFLEYSSNGGSTWTIVRTWVNGTDFSNDTFYNPTVTINSGGGISFTSTARLRLRSDFGGNAHDVYFDEVRWEGLTGGGGTPPDAPSSLAATTVSSSEIDLSWTDNSSDETSFRIERAPSAGGTYVEIDTVGANVTSYTDIELEAETTYYYRVRASNANGNSAYSNEANATTQGEPPAAPGNLAATAVSSSQINLSWTDNSSDETGFRIERATGAGGTYAEIDTVGANVTSYNNTTGLAASTTYYYRIRAYNAHGNSDYSNEASATTQSASWTTITYDDFEGGLGNYTSGGADAFLYTGGTHAHQGSNAADIQDNGGIAQSFYHTTGRNVTSYSQLRVSFWFKMVGMASGHDFFLEYSSNGGSTWTIVSTWVNGATYANNTFYNPTVTINPGGAITFTNNAKLRLRCDAAGNANDVYIDELRWEGL